MLLLCFGLLYTIFVLGYVIPELLLLQILCIKVDKHIDMSLSFPTVVKSNHRSFTKDRDCKSFKRQSSQDVNTHDGGERKARGQL